MPDRSSKKKRRKLSDINQLAGAILQEATGEELESGKNPAAVALGRLGGLKGGKARAKKLSPDERREIARNAARLRWQIKKK